MSCKICEDGGHCKAARAHFADPPRRAMIRAERASAFAAACPHAYAVQALKRVLPDYCRP